MQQANYSAKDLAQFQENIVWREVIEIINSRLEIIRTELEVGSIRIGGEGGETITATLNLEDIKKRQGGAKELRYVLELPKILQELLELDSKQKG